MRRRRILDIETHVPDCCYVGMDEVVVRPGEVVWAHRLDHEHTDPYREIVAALFLSLWARGIGRFETRALLGELGCEAAAADALPRHVKRPGRRPRVDAEGIDYATWKAVQVAKVPVCATYRHVYCSLTDRIACRYCGLVAWWRCKCSELALPGRAGETCGQCGARQVGAWDPAPRQL